MKGFITCIMLILWGVGLSAHSQIVSSGCNDTVDSIKTDYSTFLYGIPMQVSYNGTCKRSFLLVVDGLPGAIYDNNPFPQHDSVPITIDDLEKLCPLLNARTIDSFTINDDSFIPIVLEVKTKQEYAIDSFLLDGIYTTRKNKLVLGYFVSLNSKNPYYHSFRSMICKKWKLKNIRSISICPDGIDVYDKKHQLHTVYVKIGTK